MHFLEWKWNCNSIVISLKFVPEQIHDKASMVQVVRVMSWCWPGDRSLFELTMAYHLRRDTLLLRHLPNFKAISFLRDFARSYDKTSYAIWIATQFVYQYHGVFCSILISNGVIHLWTCGGTGQPVWWSMTAFKSSLPPGSWTSKGTMWQSGWCRHQVSRWKGLEQYILVVAILKWRTWAWRLFVIRMLLLLLIMIDG